MKNTIILILALFYIPLFSQVKKVSIGVEYDYFFQLRNDKMYKVKNKMIVLGFSKNWKDEKGNINNYFETSLGLTYNPVLRTYSDSTTIKAKEYVRISIEAGKRITGFDSKIVDFNFLFSCGAFSDLVDHSRLKNAINFRLVPSLEFVFFDYVFLSASAYKILLPIRPTGLNIRAGARFNF